MRCACLWLRFGGTTLVASGGSQWWPDQALARWHGWLPGAARVLGERGAAAPQVAVTPGGVVSAENQHL